MKGKVEKSEVFQIKKETSEKGNSTVSVPYKSFLLNLMIGIIIKVLICWLHLDDFLSNAPANDFPISTLS